MRGVHKELMRATGSLKYDLDKKCFWDWGIIRRAYSHFNEVYYWYLQPPHV